jgi:hypothetical protein
MGSKSTRTSRGGQDTDSTNPGKMFRMDQQQSYIPGSGLNQGEDHVGTDTSNKAQGKFPDDHQGDQGRSEGLGGSG